MRKNKTEEVRKFTKSKFESPELIEISKALKKNLSSGVKSNYD